MASLRRTSSQAVRSCTRYMSSASTCASPSKPIPSTSPSSRERRSDQISKPVASSPSTTATTATTNQRPDLRARSSREPRYNYVSNPFDDTPDPDVSHYPLVTAKELASRRIPPRRVRMLARDFIDDCLYNPHYGYFSTQAVIFDPDQIGAEAGVGPAAATTTTTGLSNGKGKQVDEARVGAEGFDFGSLRTTAQFEDEIARRYGEFEGLNKGGVGRGPGRQVWHTPTELFKPWYGRAIARFIVAEYKLNLYPYEDLIIYEIGAGNGTLMGDILDYIAMEEPEVYDRTRYRIVEISERLQGLQKGRALGGDAKAAERDLAKRKGHEDKVEVLGGSIFDFERFVPEPCFFLAMEVLDNFAHDVVRHSTEDHEPYQCIVSVDSTGDYTELYEPVTDPLIRRYLTLRSRLPSHQRTSPSLNRLMSASPMLRKLYSILPFVPNLTKPEFLPTKQLMLLDVLRNKFPAHRLLMSDFSSLPDAIPGHNAPVVQTRYEGETVACTTYLVQPGFFDIFFPTNFHLLRDLYSLVMSPAHFSSPSRNSDSTLTSGTFFSPRRPLTLNASGGPGIVRGLSVVDHGEFLERWGETEMTRVGDGSNPMIDSYGNAKFIC
ncbi:BQ2448_1719 [Microbotryum intermedium]|uniref:type II protein arginine methyltransferase n=1 Tax=Microbotryum intermedium TaxID=269621 RepID=A0A238FAT8_9BASI|nr:BQ2448_1719 [Microbotryum intermedium]